MTRGTVSGDQQRGSAGSEPWGSPALTPPQLQPHLQHPRPRLGVAVKAPLCLLSLSRQKASVQVGSVQAVTPRSGLRVPTCLPEGQSWLDSPGLCYGRLPIQRWRSGLAGLCCEPCAYCLVLRPIHPGVRSGEDRGVPDPEKAQARGHGEGQDWVRETRCE